MVPLKKGKYDKGSLHLRRWFLKGKRNMIKVPYIYVNGSFKKRKNRIKVPFIYVDSSFKKRKI